MPREELWFCMRESGVAEKNVSLVQDMSESSMTEVRYPVGMTGGFKVEVHQGLALSPFPFAMVME